MAAALVFILLCVNKKRNIYIIINIYIHIYIYIERER